jgi:hypothetical protein
MTLTGRLKRLEALLLGATHEPCPVAFEHDAKGEPNGTIQSRPLGSLTLR